MDQHCAPPRVPAELADSLGWLLARAGHAVGTALVEALAPLGTTPRELSVLAAAAPLPRPQLGLAVAVGLDKTTMVATVDALERRGLVRREQHPDDRRIRLVAVTAKGTDLLSRASAAADQVQASLLDGLSAEHRDALLPLLRGLVATAGGAPTGSCV